MTRRERNAAFDAESPPPIVIPSAGRYLWRWFEDISSVVHRTRNGVCERIPPSEYLAWAELSGLIVRPAEYAILRAMDRAFCEVMNEELKAYQDRTRDRQQQEIEKSKRNKGR